MNASTGEVRWKYETGLGIASSPAVSGDLAVIGSKDGFLYAFDFHTGQLRWKTAVGEVVTAPPLIADGAICIQAGGLFALDPVSGKTLWRAGLGGGIQSVPILTGDTVYMASLSGEIYALR
jgi:outer membrane protein assembly factor BamB